MTAIYYTYLSTPSLFSGFWVNFYDLLLSIDKICVQVKSLLNLVITLGQ